MLRASPTLDASTASHYYEAEFSRGDYYAEGAEEGIVASRWLGEGARDLRLSGRVRAAHFAALLEGKDPLSKVLVAHREGLKERRAGWDVTVSPHKSVTLTALVGGDGRVIEAHDRAVAKAVEELERNTQAWVHGGRGTETTGNAVVATFRHETSRSSSVDENARRKAGTTIDPQLHTHCVILNATRRADGEWRAVEARGIFGAQKFARAVYQAELSAELRRLGYEVQIYRDRRHGGQRVTGIAGFRGEQLDHFSNRSRQIAKALEKRGLDSRRHGSRMAVATRAAKDRDVDREALAWRWRTAAQEVGIKFPQWREPDLRERLHPSFAEETERRRVEAAARESVSGAVAHLSERRAVFSLQDLERESLARGLEAGVTIDAVRAEVERRPDLVIADPQDALAARVTTQRAVDDERALLAAVAGGRGQAPVCGELVPGHRLADDQARAARHVLASPDRFVVIEGKAGVGKTTTLSVVRETAERAGWTVRGFAPTTTATEVLREGGIEGKTVAALLKEPVPLPSAGVSRPQLWIVDEAGLLSTKQACELVARAEQTGAKVVFVGDRAQHRAVEAGSPFALVIEHGGIATERLDVVRRQRDEQLRKVVVASSEQGGTVEAVRALEASGRVVEIEDLKARHAQIAKDFIADGGRGVVIAPSNAERADLNRRIREGLIEAGLVERQSYKAEVCIRQDFTAEQKTRAANFVPGDRLRFVRAGDGIAVGERVLVLKEGGPSKLWVQYLDRKGTHLVDLRKRNGFEVERVEPRRFAVGDRVQFREQDRKLDVANGTIGTIRKIDRETGMATIQVYNRTVRVDLSQPRPIDHAYAVTSHRSQGLSRERVYVSIDTTHSAELVNRRQFYVSVSRAVEDVRVYTDDRAALTRAVAREQERQQAVEVAEQARSAAPERQRPPAAAAAQQRTVEAPTVERSDKPSRPGEEPKRESAARDDHPAAPRPQEPAAVAPESAGEQRGRNTPKDRTKLAEAVRPIDVAERRRANDQVSEPGRRADAARDLGGARREPEPDRRAEVARGEARGPARDDARAARPERGGAAGPERVPRPASGQEPVPGRAADQRQRPGAERAAEPVAGARRADTGAHERDRTPGAEAARPVVDREPADDRSRRGPVRDRRQPSERPAPVLGRAAAAAGRPEPEPELRRVVRSGGAPEVRPSRDAARPRQDDVQGSPGRGREPQPGLGREVVKPSPPLTQRPERLQDGDRVLTREEIARSPELRRGYAEEYRAAREIIPDKEAARDVARVNLSARVQNQPPVVTRETVRSLGADRVKEALSKVVTPARVTRLALTPVRAAMRAAHSASHDRDR